VCVVFVYHSSATHFLTSCFLNVSASISTRTLAIPVGCYHCGSQCACWFFFGALEVSLYFVWLLLCRCDSVQQWAVWSSISSSVTDSPRSGLASCSRTSSVCSVTGNFTDRSSVCSFCEDVSWRDLSWIISIYQSSLIIPK